MNRRRFLHLGAASTAASLAIKPALGGEVDRAFEAPVLVTDFVKDPIKVASIELLRTGRDYFLRTRSADGLEVITVPNPSRMAQTYPIVLKNILPTFIGKDARTLESLLWEVYREGSNYKLQGIALWAGVAAVEMALLELMGRATQRPVADFFGGAKKRDLAIYVASGNRGNTPEVELDYLRKIVAESGAKALKFRLGGRMNKNVDSLPGRTEALIAKVREAFGDAMTLYADSNSSYDVREAIRIGKLMEEHRYAFYEEPCEFDDLWATKEVADALTIPIAAGEQEYSMNRWRWIIANRGVDIVQPDLHYGGGYIRATKVARMAAALGMPVVPHMSGEGLGYLDVVHFASFTPNAGPFMEFKGNTHLPVHCADSPLKSVEGIVRCPAGPGFGIEIDPAYVRKATPVRPD
jgi:L-alanine-DL-glutamate epimerase-like enolase superfamily enzyme